MYVVVQAGGRGSRLRHHTWNKPKCLVSVEGKPILYHLFDYYKSNKFIIIGSYNYSQLDNYLSVNPPGVDFQLVKADGKGTVSGLRKALKLIPNDHPFLFVWSDIIIESMPIFIDTDRPIICTTSNFTCRWSVDRKNGMHEILSNKNGVAGIFYFPKAKMLPEVPLDGEFIKWLISVFNKYKYLDCPKIKELGDFKSIEFSNNREGFSRYFNSVEIKGNKVTKKVIDHNFDEVHKREIEWYQKVAELGFDRTPTIHSYSPLIMKKIDGRHPYEMFDLNDREQRATLYNVIDTLSKLHDYQKTSPIQSDVRSVYITKTVDRVSSVSKLIPNFSKEEVTVNGIKCRNIFSEKYFHLFEDILESIMPNSFNPIHGDPTFSNSLVDNSLRVWFIDPRGYFYNDGVMGDPNYDFAKVYYSAVGGYDLFNRRKFKLHMDNDTVEILMEKPVFSAVAEEVFDDYFGREMRRIKLLHGLIWLSLSGYAKDDIDSVIGAFYNGLFWLEKGLIE